MTRIVVLLCAMMSLASCGEKKTKRHVLGELVEVVEGEASRRAAKSAWSPAKAGGRFHEGEALRTNNEGIARLQFAGELLRMGPDTTVFFGKKLDFDGEIEVGEGLVDLGIDFGEAQVTTTGRVRLVKHDNEVTFEVLVGKATITQGEEVTIAVAGQELEFEIGAGVVVTEPVLPIDAGVPDAAEPEPVPPGVRAQVVGKGVRVRTQPDEPWERLAAGEHDLGSVAELELKGRKAKVLLTRGADAVTLTGSGSASVDVNAEELVRVNRGRALGRSSSADVLIAVPGGTVLLHSGKHGTKADLDVGRGGTLTVVETGKATLRNGKKSESIRGGESATLTRKGIEVTDRAPTDAHMSLRTPKSATLHVVKTPINVRIDFKEHCARGVVEVAQGRSFRRARMREGDGSAIVQLAKGSHRYRIRCYNGDSLAKSPAASGRLSVRRDSGSRPLPKKAPSNTIDADGRRYTVLFQNHMPAITFRWRNAPPSSGYVLHVQPREGRGKNRQVSTSAAGESFPSGAFAEGAYDYWFSGGGGESKHSQLVIRFDNAAATGYLSSPKAGSTLGGSSVKVAGAAVKGWKVSVAGEELRLDRQYRFDQEVPVGRNGISVRFSHPKYGVHYYVRRK